MQKIKTSGSYKKTSRQKHFFLKLHSPIAPLFQFESAISMPLIQISIYTLANQQNLAYNQRNFTDKQLNFADLAP